MNHTIKINDFEGFEQELIIASSSEGKRLVIQSYLLDGELSSRFVIKIKNSETNFQYKEYFVCKLLNIAIDKYNSI